MTRGDCDRCGAEEVPLSSVVGVEVRERKAKEWRAQLVCDDCFTERDGPTKANRRTNQVGRSRPQLGLFGGDHV